MASQLRLNLSDQVGSKQNRERGARRIGRCALIRNWRDGRFLVDVQIHGIGIILACFTKYGAAN